MQADTFDDGVEKIVLRDRRYDREAFHFLREALDHTQKTVTRENRGEPRHVSGPELLDGIREYALETYGPMTLTLFEEWGLTRCEDFGEIVFLMIDHHLLSKTDEDSKEDFKATYEFEEAFRHPFLPSRKLPKQKRERRAPAATKRQRQA